MSDEKYLAFDCETGGIDPETSLLTVYFGVLNHKLELIDELDLYCKPDNDGPYVVTAEGLEINGINLVKHHRQALTYGACGKKLRDLVIKHSGNGKVKMIPVGHNVHFDIEGVTNKILSKKNWNQYVSYRVIDTQILARGLQLKGTIPMDQSISLGNLINYLNVRGIEGVPHEAKYDTLATVEVLRKLIKL